MTMVFDSEEQAYHFEKEVRKMVDVVDWTVIPDQKDLYDTHEGFRKIVKEEKRIKILKYNFIKDNA